MGFNTFIFFKSHGGEKLTIKCNKCAAPPIDYYGEPDQKLYSAQGWTSKVNDCRSDVNLHCLSCGNTEFAEAIDILFIGR